MLLSPHFSLEELVFTQHRSLDNTPSAGVIEHLKIAAQGLERVRVLLGSHPIHVTSGYRSPAVNAAVGGVDSSAHLTGYAVDFICPGFGTPFEVCGAVSESSLNYDQLIQEGNWIHLSFDPQARRQVLTRDGVNYQLGLTSTSGCRSARDVLCHGRQPER